MSRMSNGRTTIHEVCVGGHHECLSLLLKYTDQVNVKDRDGQTPAHLAAFNGEVKCLKILSEKGEYLRMSVYSRMSIRKQKIFCLKYVNCYNHSMLLYLLEWHGF